MTRFSRLSRWQALLAGVLLAAPGMAQPIGSSNTATADPPVPRPGTTPCAVQLFSGPDVRRLLAEAVHLHAPGRLPGALGEGGPGGGLLGHRGPPVRPHGADRPRAYEHLFRHHGGALRDASAPPGTWSAISPTTARCSAPRRPATSISGTWSTPPTPGSSTAAPACCSTPPPPRRPRRGPPTPSCRCPPLRGARPCWPRRRACWRRPSRCRPTSRRPISTSSRRASRATSSGSPACRTTWRACSSAARGTSFREAEVTIDGQPAGVAPVYPWLFTGAIDPLLWRPIPERPDAEFRPLPRRSHPVRGGAQQRPAAPGGGQRLQRQQLLHGGGVAPALSRSRREPGDRRRHPQHARRRPARHDPEDLTTAADGTVSGTVIDDLGAAVHDRGLCQHLARPGADHGPADAELLEPAAVPDLGDGLHPEDHGRGRRSSRRWTPRAPMRSRTPTGISPIR